MKAINYILITLLLISLGVVAWFYFNPKIERVYVQIKPKPEIVYIEKKGGGEIATIPQQKADVPEQTLSENYIKYVNDTLKPALEEGLKYKVKFEQITRANATLQDSLTKKNIAINEAKKDAITWKSKYIEITANNSDSTVNYKYNAILDFTTYQRKKNWFSGKENLLAISSPDKNLKINGVENFTQNVTPPKNFIELNLSTQGFYFNDKIYPFGTAELIFNPDGKILPFGGYGYFFDSSNSKFYPLINIGVKYNVLKF